MKCQEIDLNQIKNAYFIGIKGVGMTALAQVFYARGIAVSGSDTHEKFFTDDVLKKLRIRVYEGFNKKNVPKNINLVVASPAYLGKSINVTKSDLVTLAKNVEVHKVIKRKIPLLSYPQVLGLLFKESYGVAVSGTHGKSTTTAMLGIILEKAGFDPTVIAGTRVNQWGTNARVSQKVAPRVPRGGNKNPPRSVLVAEADEYREAFLNYNPKILVITSIEYDHPDYFKTFRAYKNAFRKMAKKIPPEGFIVANWDDRHVRDVVKSVRCKVIAYRKNQQKTLRINLRVPGEFNILNALAALKAARALGVNSSLIKKALAEFQGTARRFEVKTTNPIIIDDYAHHPTEIRVTLKTVRELWPKKKIWVVFQPHTFSRTEALLKAFAKSFDNADRVWILETYSPARENRGRIGAKELAYEIAKYNKNVQYVSSIPIAVKTIKKALSNMCVLITMGAGNVWEIGERLTKK